MKNRKSQALLLASFATVATMGGLARLAPAASFTWDGGGADDLFGTPLNWTSDTAPVTNDALLFAGSTRTTPGNDLPANTVLGGIFFDATAGTFTVGGNAVSLGQFGHVVNNSANLQTLTLPIALAPGDHTINGGTAGLALTGGLTRSGNNSAARFLGAVSGGGLSNNSFGMIGTWATHGADYAAVGTGTLAGQIVPYTNFTELGTNPAAPLANSPGVNIRWSQGVVGGDGAGTLNLNAGLTDLNTFSAPVNNTQTVVFTPTTTLRFGAQGGVLKGANPSGLALNFGPFASENVGTITAGGADNTDGEIFFNSAFGTITVRPKITDNGTGKVRVISANGRATGSGNSLTGHNTYSGGSYVVSGDLTANEKDGFGTGSVEVAAGARAVLNPVNATTVADATYANEFFIAGFGLPGSGGLQEGAMRVSRLADAAGTIHLMADSQITFRFANATSGASISGKITGNASLTLGDSGTATRFNLNNSSNDWTGNTALMRGTLTIGGSGEVIPNGTGKGNLAFVSPVGTINLNGNTETLNGLTGGASDLDIHRFVNLAAGAATLRVGDNDANGNFGPGGLIVGNVALTKIGAGEQVFAGESTYTGTTTVEGGRLVVVNDGIYNGWNPVLNLGGADVKGGRLVFDYVSGDGAAISTQVHGILAAGFAQSPTKFATGPIRTSNPSDPIKGLGWINDEPNTEVRVAYTYYGDANLDGRVTFDDYVKIDTGFNTGLTGWVNGDFNYSGGVSFDDYVLIDISFNQQGGTLSRAIDWISGDDRSESGRTATGVAEVIEHFEEFGAAYGQAFLAAVPEPSSMLILGVPALAGTVRRRRRR
jgi:autotransporter-associated beta strand protein